jgi:DNA-binding NarL/FixJ family response regulator
MNYPDSTRAKKPPTVLVIGALDLYADALTQALRIRGFGAVAASGNEQAAVSAVRERAPDIILIDLDSLRERGVRIGEAILEESPTLKILTLGDPGTAQARKIVWTAFHGRLAETSSLSAATQAIRSVLEGLRVFEPWQSAPSARARSLDVRERQFLLELLTRREREVLTLLSKGATLNDIAGRLGIRRVTVRNHLASIMTKLNVHSRLKAVALARAYGMTSDS